MNKEHANLNMLVSGTLVILAFITLLLTRGEYDPNAFWSCYRVAAWGTSLLVLIVASLWFLASLAHARTDFFNMTRRIEPEALAVSLAVIAVVVGLSIHIMLPRLPETPPERMPKEPDLRQRIIDQQRNSRFITVVLTLVIGAGVASVPIRRFMRN